MNQGAALATTICVKVDIINNATARRKFLGKTAKMNIVAQRILKRAKIVTDKFMFCFYSGDF